MIYKNFDQNGFKKHRKSGGTTLVTISLPELPVSIQGDSYNFIHNLTSGRFRSQKALNNKLVSHTSKIGKNYHIGLIGQYLKMPFFLNLLIIYSTLHPMYNKCHDS
jgi:hypothetical protein